MRMAMGLVLALACTTPLSAQTACPATPAPLPAELSGWAGGKAVRDGGMVAVGAGSTVTLIAAPVFAVSPQKPGTPGSFGGSVSFAIAKPGRYRVALGGPAWIDVVRDKAVVASVAHGHGPACSPVRKMVDFDLPAGRYAVQISGADARDLSVLIARL